MELIANVNDFFSFLTGNLFQTRQIIFRGHSFANYELQPGIGRIGQAVTDKPFTIAEEKKMINSFIKKAHPYLEKQISDLEAMAIAQHHGLPTRLLDWTWNPLVAFFFAVEDDDNAEEDGAIYYLQTNGIEFKNPLDGVSNDTGFDPFNILNSTILYEPKFISQRIVAQSGLFSIHPNPNEAIKDERIHKIIISKHIKANLGIALETMGIHPGNLFPGLEGTSKHIKWLYTY